MWRPAWVGCPVAIVDAMPDAVPIRTADGSYISFLAVPVGPERVMRWIDRLADSNFGGSTAHVARAVAGRRGWNLLAEVDRVNGEPPVVVQVRVSKRRDAEDIVAGASAMARQGVHVDQIIEYVKHTDR